MLTMCEAAKAARIPARMLLHLLHKELLYLQFLPELRLLTVCTGNGSWSRSSCKCLFTFEYAGQTADVARSPLIESYSSLLEHLY